MSILQMILISLLYALMCASQVRAILSLQNVAFCAGGLIGLILGDVKQGLIIGAAIQTLNMAPVTTGAQATYDLLTANFVAVPIAMATGLDAESSLAIAVPVAAIGVFSTPIIRTINGVVAMQVGNKAIEKKDAGLLGLSTWLVPFLTVGLLHGIFLFVILMLGNTVTAEMMANIPEWMLKAFKVCGNIMPAVGFGIFLSASAKNETLPYFIIGFYAVYKLGLDTMTTVIVGLMVALLHLQFTAKKGAEQ